MKIAITDTGREEKQKLYLEWLHSFAPDAELTMVSYRTDAINLTGFDGLVLTGGEDVDPKFSKASPVEKVGKVDSRRDEFEFGLLDDAVKRNLPVLGICRGLQIANVFFGGTLVADLESEGYQEHTAKDKEQILRHAVTVKKESLLFDIVGTMNGDINSYHHQGVKDTADVLMPSAFSSDGVIESLEWRNKNANPFFLAVQWHPERMNDTENPFTQMIGTSFAREVKNYNSKKIIPHTQ